MVALVSSPSAVADLVASDITWRDILKLCPVPCRVFHDTFYRSKNRAMPIKFARRGKQFPNNYVPGELTITETDLGVCFAHPGIHHGKVFIFHKDLDTSPESNGISFLAPTEA